jgi:hypothetical protein
MVTLRVETLYQNITNYPPLPSTLYFSKYTHTKKTVFGFGVMFHKLHNIYPHCHQQVNDMQWDVWRVHVRPDQGFICKFNPLQAIGIKI